MPAPTETSARIRLVLSAVNDRAASVGSLTAFTVGGVALDVTKNLVEAPVLSERDLLVGGTLDLGWGSLLQSQATGVGVSVANITSATYRVVLGDGPVDTKVPTNINCLAAMFVNTYEPGAAGSQTRCVQLNKDMTVYSAQPTFSWTHANPINKAYPAFRLRVWKSNGTTLVYDSGVQKAPARDSAGVYSWAPPIYADMVTPEGVVFATTNNYKWSVSMLDAKFTTPNTNETKRDFRLECSGLGGGVWLDWGLREVLWPGDLLVQGLESHGTGPGPGIRDAGLQRNACCRTLPEGRQDHDFPDGEPRELHPQGSAGWHLLRARLH